MHHLKEISAAMDAKEATSTIKCTAFEDNNGALELAKPSKISHHAKHVAIKHHYFRSYAEKVDIIIKKVDTAE